MRVLFVCTGNICRSPMAEGVLRVKAPHFKSASAGTHGYHIGDPPDMRAIQCAKKRGYDISAQQARKVQPSDFVNFDIIFALDKGHLQILNKQKPESAEAQIVLLPSGEVPDPYYGSMRDFDHALDLIEVGIANFLEKLASPTRIERAT